MSISLPFVDGSASNAEIEEALAAYAARKQDNSKSSIANTSKSFTDIILDKLKQNPDEKYAIASSALYNNVISQIPFQHLLKNLGIEGETSKDARKGFEAPDFAAIVVIRLLYILTKQKGRSLTDNDVKAITAAFTNFSFWPCSQRSDNQDKIRMENFFSENHLLMYLSTGHLYSQFALQNGLTFLSQSNPPNRYVDEDALLLAYLKGHNSFNNSTSGFYEILSMIYQPLTFCALINLVDYCNESDTRSKAIKDEASTLLNKLVETMLLSTNAEGVGRLAATTRSPHVEPRITFKSMKISQMMALITGKCEDQVKPQMILDFLLTSSWVPDYAIILKSWNGHGYKRYMASHPINRTRSIYEAASNTSGVTNLQEIVPFYWTAGLQMNPSFVDDTTKYMKKFGLNDNPTLKALNAAKKALLGGLPAVLQNEMISSFTQGFQYTDVNVNIFKTPSRLGVLTSLEEYNTSNAVFQQLLWIANVNGVGVWTQAGDDFAKDKKDSKSDDSQAVDSTDDDKDAADSRKRSASSSITSTITRKSQRIADSMGSAVDSTTRKLSDGLGDIPALNFTPAISQQNNLLLATYVYPKSLRVFKGLDFIGNYSSAFWPTNHFDEEWREYNNNYHLPKATGEPKTFPENTWWVARRGDVYIGIICNKKTKIDTSYRNDAQVAVAPDPTATTCLRRKCSEVRHSWACLLGDEQMYSSFENFKAQCLTLRIQVTSNNSVNFGAKIGNVETHNPN